MDTSVPAKWFRLYAEFVTDPKVQMLSEADQRRFLMLLCLRCGNGDVTLHETEIAFQLRISNEQWGETKAVLLAKNLITEDNKPTAWESRQYASDSSRERVARHRENKKKHCNVTVTPPETETETETEKKKPSVPARKTEHKIEFDGQRLQNLNGHLQAWSAAFPAIDVQAEIRKAEVWLTANPKNRKSNYARFLAAWMTKAQDKAPPKGGGQSTGFSPSLPRLPNML
jgi:hypothetical protein